MECLPQNIDETHVSFDLNDIFVPDELNLSEINPDDIPDSVLSEIIVDEHFESECKSKETRSENETRSLKILNQNRFLQMESDQIDEIAGKTCKKKTHKQTEWGIKVFRGKRQFMKFNRSSKNCILCRRTLSKAMT